MSTRSEHQRLVTRAVEAYRERHPRLVEATGRYVEMVQALLDDAGINYLNVSGRTKSVESFKGKAERIVDGVPCTPTRSRTSPTGSACGSSPTCRPT